MMNKTQGKGFELYTGLAALVCQNKIHLFHKISFDGHIRISLHGIKRHYTHQALKNYELPNIYHTFIQ